MHADRSPVRMAAMFPKVNSLPCAQLQSAAAEGNGEVDAGERGTNVGGHVVGAFGGVDEEAVAIGNELCEECFEIAAHVRVGVFLDQERGAGVLDVQSAEAVFQTGI